MSHDFEQKMFIRFLLAPPRNFPLFCRKTEHSFHSLSTFHHEDFNILIIFGSSRSQDHASFNNFADLLSIIFPAKIKVKSNLLSEDVQQELVAKPQ